MIPIIKASRQQLTLIILHFSYFLYEIFQFVKLDKRKTAFLRAVKTWKTLVCVYFSLLFILTREGNYETIYAKARLF